MVVSRWTYWFDMSLHTNTFVENSPLFTEALVVRDDALICNTGIFRDLTCIVEAKKIQFMLLSFNFRRFWIIQSQISANKCYKLFMEEIRNRSHCHDPVIDATTYVYHRHNTSPINKQWQNIKHNTMNRYLRLSGSFGRIRTQTILIFCDQLSCQTQQITLE